MLSLILCPRAKPVQIVFSVWVSFGERKWVTYNEPRGSPSGPHPRYGDEADRAGIAIGIPVAFAAGPVIVSLIFGVKPWAAVLVSVSLLAPGAALVAG
jgi:hypothetical protein